MDWLDKISIATLGVLLCITVIMVAQSEIAHRKQDNPGHEEGAKQPSYRLKQERNDRIFKEVRSQIKAGDLDNAIGALKEIMEKHPDNAQTYVYMAQIKLRRGKLGESIQNYRQAVEMEPDFVDQRTPFYIGDKLEVLVREGMDKYKREKELKPGDQSVDKVLKDVYYLQRRLAGGCE